MTKSGQVTRNTQSITETWKDWMTMGTPKNKHQEKEGGSIATPLKAAIAINYSLYNIFI